ncbi:MAG: hypothetical protein AAGD01_08335 [Acidobacteriota bacterium]
MNRRLRPCRSYTFLPFLALALWFAPAAIAQDDVILGSLFGDLTWSDLTPVTSTHITANPVLDAPVNPLTGNNDTVSAYPPGQFIAVARGVYAPDNSQPTAASYRAATYQLAVPVSAGGSSFLLGVDSVQLQGAARYRFGSRRAGSPWSELCAGVLPTADQPAGVRCDLQECPALLELNVRLVGSATDLADLQEPIGCAAQIGVEEIAGLGSYDLQARSGSNPFTKTQLTGAGAGVSVLARSGAALQVQVGCAATPVSGASGFPLDPDTGSAVFAAVVEIPAAACGASVPVDVDVPVERNAGDLTGLFDIAGYGEHSAYVRPRSALGGGFLGAVFPPTFGAGDAPDRDEAGDFWIFEGLVEGDWELEGRAVIAGGDQLLRLPFQGGANGVVEVVAGATTDLDTTFVVRPREASGRVVLVDPGGFTDLDRLLNQPITSLSINNLSTTLEARGDDDVAVVEDGGSGYGGRSFGRLAGSYDPQQERAELDYQLLLAGLSPVGDSLDGSDARPTPWEVTSLRLELGDDADYRQSVRVELDQDLHYVVGPSSADEPPLAIPQQSVCFGQIEAELRVRPNDGSLYAPELEVLNLTSITSAETAIPNVTYRARGWSTGTPRTTAESSPQAQVRLTLPEGIRYPVRPQVRFLNGSSDTLLTFETRSLPAVGELACGAVHGVCLDIDAGSGTTVPLTTAFDPAPPVCLPQGQELTLSVHVESGGLPVDAVTYSLDGGPPQLLCGPCSADPSNLEIPIPALDAGIHDLVVDAGSTNGCSARLTHPLAVADGDLVLTCPASVEIALEPGEQEIAATDPRIADELVASATGACNLPVPIFDDRPETFLSGDTTVTFSAEGSTCQSTVRLSGSRSQVALVDGNEVRVHRFDGAMDWQVDFDRPRDLDYNSAGEKLAVLDNFGVTVVHANDGTSLLSYPSFANPFRRVAFRPGSDEDLAFLVQGTNLQRNGPYYLWVRLQGVSQPLQSVPLQMPAGWSISAPSIAWSPDGSRITAAFDAVFSAATVSQNEHRLFVYEWDVTDGALGAPELAQDWNRDRREAVLSVGYLGDDLRAVSTTNALYRITPNGLLQAILPSQLGALSLAVIGPEPAAAVFGAQPPRLSLVTEGAVGQAAGPGVKGTAIAFAVDPHRRAALGIGDEGYRLYLIEVTQSQLTLSQDITIPTTGAARAIAFRPSGP